MVQRQVVEDASSLMRRCAASEMLKVEGQGSDALVLFFSDHAILKKGFCKVKRNIVSITIE
jgi:hypothetical protein